MKKTLFALLAVAVVVGISGYAYAVSSYLSSFTGKYAGTSGTPLNACILCHNSSSGGSRNAYGSAFEGQPHSTAAQRTTAFTDIEGVDSDRDTFTNIVEINARTFPGNSASVPAVQPPPDNTAPSVTRFTVPATSTSRTVSPISVQANDTVGITGYIITESATAPAASATGWTATAPTSYTFAASATSGAKTLFAYAKDAAGNRSAGFSATLDLNLPAPDITAPSVTRFTVPATSTSRTVSPISVSANDTVGVTGYIITESATTPAAAATGWSTGAPTSYTFAASATSGAKTLYAYAKDAAGNRSAGFSATVTLNLPVADTTAPTVDVFTLPADSSSLTVPITAFVFTDNVGVTGVMVRESAARPGANAAGWLASPPSSYNFTTAGSKTLNAWAKDAAGNVSVSAAIATVTITTGTPAPADGAALYSQNCQSCHGALTSSTINNRTVSGIQSALNSVGSMSGISLTAPEIQAIATALATPAPGPGPGPGPAPQAGMEIWNNTWFAVNISSQGVTAQGTAAGGRQKVKGYLNILTWDEANSILDATLYQYNQGTGQWTSEPLAMNFASGDPLSFQVSSQGTGNVTYGFTARIKGTAKNGFLSKAKFKTLGGYLVQSPASNDEDDEDDESNPGNRSGWLKITGKLVPESAVPVQ